MTDKDIFDNRLIFGDNLLALKALEQAFTGEVKGICKWVTEKSVPHFLRCLEIGAESSGVYTKSLTCLHVNNRK